MFLQIRVKVLKKNEVDITEYLVVKCEVPSSGYKDFTGLSLKLKHHLNNIA